LIILAIEKGDIIKVSYTGKFGGDQIFDTTDEELAKANEIYNPRGMYGGDVVIVGAGHTIAGLDEDFAGKEVGYSGTVIVTPEKGFGDHDPKLVENISLTKFKDHKAYPGMNVELDNKRGTVVKVIGRRVRVDFNHPLAGKDINYEYSIDEKIEEPIEKVKGLLALYTGVPDLEVAIEDNKVSIDVPAMLSFNQRWLMAKGRVASELIEHLGLEKVSYVESYPVQMPEPVVETATEEEVTESEE
jgi:FKBP-type peptidyl-prolyl cis-trans isomerase SlyD